VGSAIVAAVYIARASDRRPAVSCSLPVSYATRAVCSPRGYRATYSSHARIAAAVSFSRRLRSPTRIERLPGIRRIVMAAARR
jgi:hypothetical protein